MTDIRQTSTNYVHPTDPNLLNIHKAMKFNSDGEPVVRTHVDGITLEGDVIVDTVSLSTSTLNALESINVQNTVSVTVSNFPTTSTVYQGTTPWNITGTVSVSSLPEVEIKNDTGNPISVSANTATNNSSNPIFVKGTADTSFFSPTQTDAFGRLRVSNPFTLFDGDMRYYDEPFKWSQKVNGSGTSTFLINESSVLMTVTGNGDSVTRETKTVFKYQPGKSLLTMCTFVMNTPTSGLRQRVGFFGAQNGVYFEIDGTAVNLVIRKYTSGVVDDTTEKIPQNLWTGDTLNPAYGNNPSGITLNLNKSQIFWCDVEWLGVGSVRAGFVINGQFIVCHTFHHANSFDKVYMTTATLPVRYEITSTGAAGSMRAICSTVISEGGYVNRSTSRSIGSSLAGKTLSNTSYTPLVCIRLKSSRLDNVVVPSKFDLYGLQQSAFVYRVILNPTLTGASWVSADTNSCVEYDISATGLTGGTGTVLDQGIFVGSAKGGTASVSSSEVDFSQQLGRDLDGVADIWCLAAISTTNNDSAVAAVSWQEHV